MNKQEFLLRPEVNDFCTWLAQKAETLEITLGIRSSPQVPGGISKKVKGIEAVVAEYVWKGKRWEETKADIASFRASLNDALRPRRITALLPACYEVLKWGVSATR